MFVHIRFYRIYPGLYNALSPQADPGSHTQSPQNGASRIWILERSQSPDTAVPGGRSGDIRQRWWSVVVGKSVCRPGCDVHGIQLLADIYMQTHTCTYKLIDKYVCMILHKIGHSYDEVIKKYTCST